MLERIKQSLKKCATHIVPRRLKSADRRLRFEQCEARCMLAAMADVLFIVDESGSEQNTHTQDWLATVIDDLHATLSAASIDARYGMVGFGVDYDNGTPSLTDDTRRNAHSHLLGPVGSKALWTTSYAELVSAIAGELGQNGQANSEDGWDAIDHALAEYSFRENAVTLLVLVQGDEGRRQLNNTLTHDGILATLDSKNVILDCITPGQLLVNGVPPTSNPEEPLSQPPGASFDWAPVFDLAPYGLSSDVYVLGVEADATDNAADGQHNYYAFNTVTNTVPSSLPTTEADAIQVSFNGSNTGATGMVGTGKSILIGQNLSGGIYDANVTAGEFNYHATSVPYQFVNMSSGTTTITPGSTVLFPGTAGFQFFGNTYGTTSSPQIFVDRVGTITFGASDSSGDNVDLSFNAGGPGNDSRSTTPTIAALWDNLVSTYDSGSGLLLTKSVDADNDTQNDLVI